MASVDTKTVMSASNSPKSPSQKPGEFSVVVTPEIYDTEISIREKIAAEKQTLPQFIVLPPDFELTAGEITAVDLTSAVYETDDFRTFYNRFPNVDPNILVQAYTFSRNSMFSLLPEMKMTILHEVKAVLPETRELPEVITVNKFIEDYVAKQEAIRLLLDQNPIENTGLILDFNVFTAYFQDNQDNFEWTSSEDIFNRANPTVLAPIVVLNNHWKIRQGTYGFPTEISDQNDNSIYVFLELAPQRFTLAHVIPGNENRVKISVEAAAYAAAITPDILIQRVGEIFEIPAENMLITQPETQFLKGSLTFFGVQFNADVLADIILNDSVVNKWFYKNDLRKATREKSGLFVYFTPSENETGWPVTLVSGNLADATDSQRARFGKTHTSGGFVTATIKVKSQQESEFLQQALQGLLHRYMALSGEYSENYKTFIPNWKEIPPVSRAELSDVESLDYLQNAKQRSALDPVLFPPLIVRKCPPEKQPWVVLNPQEISRIKANDDPDTYLEFPRPQEYPLFKRDFQPWIQPRLFTCRRKKGRGFAKEQYVSMVPLPNPLPDPKDPDKILDLQVPVALCCEMKNNRNTRGTVLNQWLNGTISNFQKPMENTKGTTTFTSVKIAPRGRKGVLPSGVLAILSSIIPKGTWYRYGVSSRENSAIEAVAMAKEMGVSEQDITRYRQDPVVLPIVCAQENPGKSLETLEHDIRGEGYFSPRSFYRFLEELFGVRIILFIREGINKTTPGSLYGFQAMYGEYFFESDLPVVCLLEHGGAERDALSFPQTELIVHEFGRTITKVFTDTAAENLVKLRQKACQFQLWSQPIPQTMQTLPIIPKVSRQVIDQFGKCRGVELKSRVFVEIPPSPPYNVPTMMLSEIPRFEKWEKLEKYGITLKSDPVDGRNPATMVINDFTINVTVITAPVEESTAEIFWRNKKLARVLQELFYIEFSKWWDSAGSLEIAELTFISVQGFAINNTEIIETMVYPAVNAKLEDNRGFYRGRKLILPSEEVQNRLLFMLWRDYQRDPNKINNMKSQKILKSLYLDRYDYRQIPGVSLVKFEALEQYQNISKPAIISLQYTIDPTLTDPFFLSLDSKVFLARNFPDLDSAIKSGVGWESGGTREAVPVYPADTRWKYRLYVSREKYLVGPVDGRIANGFEVLSYLYEKGKDNVVQGYTVVYW